MNIDQLKHNIQFIYVLKSRRRPSGYLTDSGYICTNIDDAIKFDTYKDAKTFLYKIFNPCNECYKVIQIKI